MASEFNRQLEEEKKAYMDEVNRLKSITAKLYPDEFHQNS